MKIIILFLALFFSSFSAFSASASPTYSYTCPSGYSFGGFSSSNALPTSGNVMPSPDLVAVCNRAVPYSSTHVGAYVNCSTNYYRASNSQYTCYDTPPTGYYLNTTIHIYQPIPGCPTGQIFNTTTRTCENAVPTCTASQYLDATTNQCVSNPTCVGGQTLNTITYQCENPICVTPEYLDLTTYTCATNPTCIGGLSLDYSAHQCVAPTCSDDEYMNTDFYCRPTSETCTVNQTYDTAIHQCKEIICEGDLILNNGHCEIPACPQSNDPNFPITYVDGARHCGYRFPPYRKYNFSAGVSYRRIQYGDNGYRFLFSIPARPEESQAESMPDPTGYPVDGKMSVTSHDGGYWYSAIAKVPAFNKQLQFKVTRRISFDSIAEKLLYVEAMSQEFDVLSIYRLPAQAYSLDVMYAMGYGLDKILSIFVSDAEANPFLAAAWAGRAAWAGAKLYCKRNPKSCGAALEVAGGVLECLLDPSCWFLGQPDPPPACTPDPYIQQCDAGAITNDGTMAIEGEGEAVGCQPGWVRVHGLGELKFGSICKKIPCVQVKNPNQCPGSGEGSSDGSGGKGGEPTVDPAYPPDLKDMVKGGLNKDGGSSPMGDGDTGIKGDLKDEIGDMFKEGFGAGTPEDPLDLSKPSASGGGGGGGVDMTKQGDNTAEPLKSKDPLSDTTDYKPDGSIEKSSSTVDSSCDGLQCESTKSTTTETTKPDGTKSSSTETTQLPDDPSLGGSSGGGSGGGTGTTPTGGEDKIVNCDKYPNSLGCIDPGTPEPPEDLQTYEVPADIQVPVGSAGTCPQPIKVNLGSVGDYFNVGEKEITFQYLCDTLSKARPAVIAAAYISAAYIFFQG